MKRKFSLKKLFENNRFVLIFSVLVAILCWITVGMTEASYISQSIGGVPVKLELKDDELRAIGLSAVGTVDTLVDVMVEGNRTVVGSLTSEDFNITVSLSGITEPDTYSLTLYNKG